jgi:hypothetical protein
MTSSTTSGMHPQIEQLARRFPLVPRYRPPVLPLPQQLAEIADLAATPPGQPDAASRIAAAHNKAALIASNCGHPDLARRLCWQHHHRYLDHQPWTAADARRALEPLVNLARLHIRADHPDAAVNLLESLLLAVADSGTALIDGHPVDLGPVLATPDDRRTTRRWIWTVTLAEGLRALARASRWDDALSHAERHHGIGVTLLDGRQIAILTQLHRADPSSASALLRESMRAEPWQDTVADVLALMLERSSGETVSRAEASPRSLPSVSSVFAAEVQLATLDLLDDPDRSQLLGEVMRSVSMISNAAIARAILTHPAGQHLSAALPEQLLAVHAVAARPSVRADVESALTSALGVLASATE